jgi:hypothetical protein
MSSKDRRNEERRVMKFRESAPAPYARSGRES